MAFYKEAGYLVLGSRLKRLSDKILSDVSKVYRDEGIPFDISWFPFFFLMHEKGPQAITVMAQELRISHPAVVQFVEKMDRAGVVRTAKDKKDGRRTIVSFTPKGKKLLGKALPVWTAIEDAMGEMMVEKVHLRFMLDSLRELEKSLDEKDLALRIRGQLDKQ